jgi:hypothetical protein
VRSFGVASVDRSFVERAMQLIEAHRRHSDLPSLKRSINARQTAIHRGNRLSPR